MKQIKTNGPVKIDLGCGNKKKKGFIGLDINKGSDADYFCDLSKGIPLADNTVDELYSSHFIEHLDDYNFMMHEIIRVCKNNARVEIILPYYSYIGATLHSYWDNPHRHVFSEAYFYWKDVNPCFNNYKIELIEYKFVKYKILGRNIKNIIFYFIYNFILSGDTKRVHFLNAVEEFRIILRVRK